MIGQNIEVMCNFSENTIMKGKWNQLKMVSGNDIETVATYEPIADKSKVCERVMLILNYNLEKGMYIPWGYLMKTLIIKIKMVKL